MLQVGVLLVALGFLIILFEPRWLPRFIRRAVPHLGYLVLGFAAIADDVTVAHIDGQIAVAPDSSLRMIAPVLLKNAPRTTITLLPPDFVGTQQTLTVALQLTLMVVAAVIFIAFTKPEWLRPVARLLTRIGLALMIVLAAWTTGIYARTLNVIRERVRTDGDSPLRSIADVIGAIPGEYHRSVYAMLAILGGVLCLWVTRRLLLAFRRTRRQSRLWNAA